MILLDKITIKISQIVNHFSYNGKLPNFSIKLSHFIFPDVLSIFCFPSKITEQCIKKIYDSAIFGIEVVSEF